MTTGSYPTGWSRESQVRGSAHSPSECAWNVNFNNGNANWNNRNNDGFVRAVRDGEYPGAIPLRELHTAWLEARRGKVPSRNRLHFEAHWIDRLLELQAALKAGTWWPSPPTCFIARRPKAREIHAPDFADRVVHHWIVPQLEAIYEPVFIHDSYSNRRGKGTHAAVERLQGFSRQLQSGVGSAWYLQLDIHNFFNSIHRRTLYELLSARMRRHGLSLPLRQAVHALLRQAPTHKGVRYAATPAERRRVPRHKQLAHAAPGCGIAIGNLSSQFFANVYLDRLDQFVKHELGARRYLRYVDDFVLLHRDPEQLVTWRAAIEGFLAKHLQLRLKDAGILKPAAAGVDFLGYIVRPTHRTVRPRVVHHAREKLRRWRRRHVGDREIVATPAQYRALRSTWSSYVGHFAKASTAHLQTRLHREFRWLRTALMRRRYGAHLEGKRCVARRPRSSS